MTPIFRQWRISHLPSALFYPSAAAGSLGISQSHWPTENGESATSYPKQQLEAEPHWNLDTLELQIVQLVPRSTIAHEDSRRLCPSHNQTYEFNLSLLSIYNRCSPKMSDLPGFSQTERHGWRIFAACCNPACDCRCPQTERVLWFPSPNLQNNVNYCKLAISVRFAW